MVIQKNQHKVTILTNKDANKLSITNGHDYRLIKILQYADNVKISPSNISLKEPRNIVIDIPGTNIIKLIKHIKKRPVVFLQDSMARYYKSKTTFLYKSNQLLSRSMFKSTILYFLFSINEFLILLLFRKVGFVSCSDFSFKYLFEKKLFKISNGIHDIEKKTTPPFNTPSIKLCYWGNFLYPPNADSLSFFLKKYWGKIKEHFPKAEMHLFGKNCNMIKSESQKYKDVFLRGEFESFSEIHECDIFMNFVEYGAGMKNKTLEGIIMNIPMIATHHAIEGIEQLKHYPYIYRNYYQLKKSLDEICNYSQNTAIDIENIMEMYNWKKSTKDYINQIIK